MFYLSIAYAYQRALRFQAKRLTTHLLVGIILILKYFLRSITCAIFDFIPNLMRNFDKLHIKLRITKIKSIKSSYHENMWLVDSNKISLEYTVSYILATIYKAHLDDD